MASFRSSVDAFSGSPRLRNACSFASAALDGTITVSLLLEISGLAEGALREAIEELLDRRIVSEHDWHVDHYAFPHASIRNAVYHAIAEDERAAFHLRIAQRARSR